MIDIKRFSSCDDDFALRLEALLAFEGAQDAAVDQAVFHLPIAALYETGSRGLHQAAGLDLDQQGAVDRRQKLGGVKVVVHLQSHS